MYTVNGIPVFDDNYVWVIHHPTSQEVCVVDPGDGDAVVDYLKTQNLRLSRILITHSHSDHISGIDQVLSHQNAPVYGPVCSAIPQVTHPVGDNDVIELWGDSISCWHLPGHLPEHMAYLFQRDETPQLFSGDILFSGGCGRIFNGTHTELKESIDRIKSLPMQSHIYGAHEYTLSNLKFAAVVEPGNRDIEKYKARIESLRDHGQASLPTKLENELKINPFLRCDAPSVTESVKKHAGNEPKSELEVFQILREWKNVF